LSCGFYRQIGCCRAGKDTKDTRDTKDLKGKDRPVVLGVLEVLGVLIVLGNTFLPLSTSCRMGVSDPSEEACP
jgi:hypothetical protein